ncbi:MAG TPA: lipoxygenase family protein [Pyrinomonadaceae bacterium]|jgi:arachidonate 15-lipoxygenase
MPTLSDIIDELFMCLGPLRACEEPFQERCVEPVQEYIVEPVQERCVDPVRRYLEISPLTCLPWVDITPNLPQNESTAQQYARASQLGRTRGHYQYNYRLVRTFRVEQRGNRKVGVQGRGIAVLDSLPFSQQPSIWWLVEVVREALLVVDNLLLVLDLLLQQPQQQNRGQMRAEATARVAAASPDDEPDIVDVTAGQVSTEELEVRRGELQRFRANLLGTLIAGRRLTQRARVDGEGAEETQPLRAPTPIAEGGEGGTAVALKSSSSVAPDAPPATGVAPATDVAPAPPSLCTCLRCNPQSFMKEMFEDIKHQLASIVEMMMQIPSLDSRPYSIKAYNDLFQRIPLPPFALTFRNNEMFALQRVAGQNPVVIQRVEWTAEWAEKLPVTPEQYSAVMGDDDDLETAGGEGRLYVCDYGESLGNVIAGCFPEFIGQKYINAPVALFALLKEDRRVIRAVAIQAGQEPGPNNPVITPGDGWNWEIAKTILQNADCNDSEYWQHLGLGHLLSEAFALATYRQLPTQHPLHALLTPHFENMFATNNTAVTSINDEGSYLNITEMIFSGTVPATLGIAANAVAGVNFTDNMLRNQLRRRGVDDPQLLPNYPYRDDALLVWEAIHRWVSDYLRIYYKSDLDVVGDYELQNWVAEVSSRQGGRIKGVGENGVGGRITTLEYLIDCITQVIYTASAHHALTNFPLEDYELYHPGWPAAIYRPAPTRAQGATRRDWLAYLSPLNIALLQQALGTVIGGTYYTQLGAYPLFAFDDARVRAPLNAFRAELRRVEEIIRERNVTRPLKYPYLLPSRIPASTNI